MFEVEFEFMLNPGELFFGILHTFVQLTEQSWLMVVHSKETNIFCNRSNPANC